MNKLSLALTLLILSGPALSKTVDVTSYGANGTDTTDDTSAFNSAIAAASAGDTLVIPNGNYYISQTLYITKDHLFITSNGATLTKADPTKTLIEVNANYVTIENIEINGSATTTAQGGNGGPINRAGGSGITIVGTYQSAGTYNTVRNSKIYSNQGHGIALYGTNTGTPLYWCTHSNINNNVIYSNNQTGILQNQCWDDIISGNHIHDNGAEGITVYSDSRRSNVSNNRVESNCQIAGVAEIALDNSPYSTISNNVISDSANDCGAGIKAQNNTGYTLYTTITSNAITNSTGPGVWLATKTVSGISYNTEYVTVTSNIIAVPTGSSNAAITIGTNGMYNIITSNIVNGASIIDNGMLNIVANNQ